MKSFNKGSAFAPESSIPTRRSLLGRLKNWEDGESWQQFFDTYWRLIYAVALKSGLRDDEAQEVVQETVVSIAKKMDTFVYDPAVCPFKCWLKRLTRLRILDQFGKRDPRLTPWAGSGQETDTRTTRVERLADPQGSELERIWEEEWEQNLLDVALRRLKHHLRPQHYQVFFLSSVRRKTPGEVARMLGMSRAQVYLVRHRVSRRMRKELENLESRSL